jgi:cytoskeletal protein CcmA (bactofilin family)
VAEIIREVFDITDRTIAYYPVYQLTFENGKNGKDATVTVNGVTGEIFLNKTKKLAAKTIIDPDQGTGIRSNLATLYEVAPPEPILNFNPPETTKSAQTFPKEKETIQPTKFEEETMILGFPAKITGKVFTEGNNMAAVVGDIEIPPRTSVNKTLVVKGTLRIGENCKVRGKLKAQNINVGAKTIIDGDVISGENGLFGSGVLITGRLQAGGHIRIGEQATINQGSDLDPTAEMDNNIQLEANIGNTVDSVAHETRKAKSAKSN